MQKCSSMKLRYLCSLLLLVSIIACDDDEMMTPPQPDQIQFGGISQTDATGRLIGTADYTDWGLGDEWEDRISALFPGEQRPLCFITDEYIAFSAAPNPAIIETALSYEVDDSTDLELRIVDRDYNLLKEISVSKVFSRGYNRLLVNLEELNINNDTVRIYYKLITGLDCELRGHGDIAIE